MGKSKANMHLSRSNTRDSNMCCFSSLLCRNTSFLGELPNFLSRSKTRALSHRAPWEDIHKEPSSAHPRNGPQFPSLSRKGSLFSQRGELIMWQFCPFNVAQIQLFFTVSLLLSLDPRLDKYLHIVHVATDLTLALKKEEIRVFSISYNV